MLMSRKANDFLTPEIDLLVPLMRGVGEGQTRRKTSFPLFLIKSPNANNSKNNNSRLTEV